MADARTLPKDIPPPNTDNLQGAGWILLSGVMATGMALGIRALGPTIAAPQIVFVRCLLGLAMVVPMALGGPGLYTRRWKLHILRGLMASVAINCGFYAFTALPVATATVLFFTTPLFLTWLAPWLLGETVGWRRRGATLVGFAGAVVVLNPTTAPDPAMGAALTAALLYALSLIITKRLSTTESPALLMFYFGVVTSLASMPLALWMWRPPGLVDMVLLVVVAVCATARVYCDIRGFSLGEASFVGPFQYLRILLGALGAYWLFAEIPDLNTWAGAALIIASTLYIAQREWRLKRQQRRASSLPEPHTKAPNP